MMIPTPTLPATRTRLVGPAVRRARIQTAGRMRMLRERQREAGIPDPATLDRCIVDAVRDEIARIKVRDEIARSKRENNEDEYSKEDQLRDDLLLGQLDLGEILRGARSHWKARRRKARDAGRDVGAYDPAPVVQALHERLLSPRVAA